MADKKYLSPEGVAEKFNISPVTVRKWLRDGALKGFKVGNRLWRVKERDLEVFMKGDK